jgi:hypothetical protein
VYLLSRKKEKANSTQLQQYYTTVAHTLSFQHHNIQQCAQNNLTGRQAPETVLALCQIKFQLEGV